MSATRASACPAQIDPGMARTLPAAGGCARRNRPIGSVTQFLWAAVALALAVPLSAAPAAAQGFEPPILQAPLGEIVDRTTLRVCADPGNLPYSNDKGEGFENKIAELIAAEFGVPITYTWFPQTVGFVRMTLAAHRCDLIIGVATTNELMQNTNPYYRAAYMLVHRADMPIETGRLDDPIFQPLRLGIQPGTPGATTAARNGLLDQSKHYPLVVDTRIEKPARDMVEDVSEGVIDVGIVWGPLAGYWIREIDPSLVMRPLEAASGTERVDYRISMGIRYNEPVWKEELNAILMEKKPEIDAILQSFGVPLLNNAGRMIEPLAQPALPAATPTQDRTDNVAPAFVDEPPALRTENYQAPVPAGLTGARVLVLSDTDRDGIQPAVAADRAQQDGDTLDAARAVFIDVMPAQRKPEGRPDGAIWREPQRVSIAGAHWLANMGHGALTPGEDAAFRMELNRLAGPDGTAPLVFFCEPDCWMSWNAAKRAVSYGFDNVIWFPEGRAGWEAAGLPLETLKPWRPSAPLAMQR
jgi:quinoprotein dehydrogenase-associated probable ABC transporter substrate-binding protein/PQQ-dependent catabolism-associated CXXCW motif protein